MFSYNRKKGESIYVDRMFWSLVDIAFEHKRLSQFSSRMLLL